MAHIDQLATIKSTIDLSGHSEGDFGLEDFELSFIFDDIILVEYIDLSEDKDGIMRNGLYIPANTLQKAWRMGKIILAGPLVKYAKVGDVVLFPNNLGITVANVDITGHGRVSRGVFLNEARSFGLCKRKELHNDSTKTDA